MSARDPDGLRWRKSRFSSPQGNCVEVAAAPGGVAVRDSRDPAGPALTFTFAAWRAFTRRARQGAFDR
jgi:Domain of unknown function (DUF397)